MVSTILFYLFGLLLIFIGILWLKDPTNIFSSLIFIASGLLLFPVFNIYFKNKFSFTDKTWTAIKIVISVVGCIAGIALGIMNYTSKENKNITKAEKIIEQAKTLFINDQVDSALVMIKKANDLYPKMSEKNLARDLMREYNLSKSLEQVNKILLSMNEQEYALLLKNQLTKKYFAFDKFNEVFLTKLYENRLNRSKLIKGQEQRARKLAADAMKVAAIMRKEYETTLRTAFLDSGLDIKVSVYGTNNTKLKLTYILFNDIWSRKISKEGYLEKWRALGFERAYITDGHDYTVYWDLDE